MTFGQAGWILLLGLSAMGCVSAPTPCGHCVVAVPETIAVSHAAELREQLRGALQALSACDPSSAMLAGAGLEDPNTSGQRPVTTALQCLAVTNVEKSDAYEVVLYLAPVSAHGRAAKPELVMLASWDGTRWRFTWPALRGPEEIR